jgi:predicted RNA methylase
VVRLLDPCAGTGEAAATLARALGAIGYGIEINEERTRAAAQRLDHVLATSAFTVRLANGAFSCLYLNPPYSTDEEQRRLEHAFLTALTWSLAPGGVLVFVIPQRRLHVSARYLASHYTAFRVFRFPDSEYAAFGQVVLLAALKPRPFPEPTAQARLEAWASSNLPPLSADHPDVSPLTVPALPTGDVLFASLYFDPEQAAAEARRRGAWVQPQVIAQLWPADELPVRPLMPLRRGHLALLTAAGMLNNAVLEQGGRRILVNGRVRKEFVARETEDENVEISREVLRTSVTVLDLMTGAIEVVDQGGGTTSGEEEAA